jgi:hypothetical protein
MPRRRHGKRVGGDEAANQDGGPGHRPARDQARAAAPVALKIDVCASSGSMTPMIF